MNDISGHIKLYLVIISATAHCCDHDMYQYCDTIITSVFVLIFISSIVIIFMSVPTTYTCLTCFRILSLQKYYLLLLSVFVIYSYPVSVLCFLKHCLQYEKGVSEHCTSKIMVAVKNIYMYVSCQYYVIFSRNNICNTM